MPKDDVSRVLHNTIVEAAAATTTDSVKDDSTNKRRTEENNLFFLAEYYVMNSSKSLSLVSYYARIEQDRRPNVATLPSSGAARRKERDRRRGKTSTETKVIRKFNDFKSRGCKRSSERVFYLLLLFNFFNGTGMRGHGRAWGHVRHATPHN